MRGASIKVLAVIGIVISLTALFYFESLSSWFLFLSPDGKVEPLMLLMLRICLLSVGPVGVTVLLCHRLPNTLNVFDNYLLSLSTRQFITLCLLTASILRVLVIAIWPSVLWADYKSYDELAWTLTSTGEYLNEGYYTAYWPPAYPFVLSLLYRIFGHAPTVGLLLNVLLGSVTCLLTYLIARTVGTERQARWAMVILVLFPSQILFTNLLASEMLFTPLLLLSVYLMLQPNKSMKAAWVLMFLGGIFLGLATLTRVISKYLILVFMPVWYLRERSALQVVRQVLPALLGLLVMLLPWMYRNSQVMGACVINTNTGVNLYIGNQPGAGMGYNKVLADQIDVNDTRREVENDRQAWGKGWRYIIDEPASFLKRGILKLVFFYAVDFDVLQYQLINTADKQIDTWSVYMSIIAESFYLLVLGAAFLTLFRKIWRRAFWEEAGFVALVGIIFYWSALHFVFYGTGRYHFPIVPILAIFAAGFVESGIEFYKKNVKF